MSTQQQFAVTPEPTADAVLAALRRLRVGVTVREFDLYVAIANELERADIPFAREVVLAPRNRIDFKERERTSRLYDWRTFASAPQDGTEILVYREDSGAFTACYAPARTEHGEEDLDNYCWFTTDGGDLTGDLPTHWMPLPEGPGCMQSGASEIDRLTAELKRRDVLQDAELAGTSARLDGQPIDVTPHPAGSELAQVWKANWLLIDREQTLLSDNTALQAQLEASEAGAAAMREALDLAAQHFAWINGAASAAIHRCGLPHWSPADLAREMGNLATKAYQANRAARAALESTAGASLLADYLAAALAPKGDKPNG